MAVKTKRPVAVQEDEVLPTILRERLDRAKGNPVLAAQLPWPPLYWLPGRPCTYAEWERWPRLSKS